VLGVTDEEKILAGVYRREKERVRKNGLGGGKRTMTLGLRFER
jgi:hypothetical protein